CPPVCLSSPRTLAASLQSMTPHVFLTLPATPEIYTLSLHDALPISAAGARDLVAGRVRAAADRAGRIDVRAASPSIRDRGSGARSEEHTSELQSRGHLVCRLLLEKKNLAQNRRDARLRNSVDSSATI